MKSQDNWFLISDDLSLSPRQRQVSRRWVQKSDPKPGGAAPRDRPTNTDSTVECSRGQLAVAALVLTRTPVTTRSHSSHITHRPCQIKFTLSLLPRRALQKKIKVFRMSSGEKQNRSMTVLFSGWFPVAHDKVGRVRCYR